MKNGKLWFAFLATRKERDELLKKLLKEQDKCTDLSNAVLELGLKLSEEAQKAKLWENRSEVLSGTVSQQKTELDTLSVDHAELKLSYNDMAESLAGAHAELEAMQQMSQDKDERLNHLATEKNDLATRLREKTIICERNRPSAINADTLRMREALLSIANGCSWEPTRKFAKSVLDNLSCKEYITIPTGALGDRASGCRVMIVIDNIVERIAENSGAMVLHDDVIGLKHFMCMNLCHGVCQDIYVQ